MTTRYIGKILFQPIPFTRIEPLAVQDGGRWSQKVDRDGVFKPKGGAFSRNLEGFDEGDLVVFEITVDPDVEEGHDQAIVTRCNKARDIWDFRQAGEDAARDLLVEQGIDELPPKLNKLTVAIGQGRCVQVELADLTHSGRYVASSEGLEALPVREFNNRLFMGDRIEDRWIEIPGRTIGEVVSTTNWVRDADFLRSVLNKLNKLVPPDSKTLSRDDINRVVAYLQRADLLSSRDDTAVLATRLSRFQPEFLAKTDALHEVVEKLLGFDAVADKYRARAEALREEVERELREKIAVEIEEEVRRDTADLNGRREALIEENDRMSARLEALREELDTAEADRVSFRRTASDELLRIVGELADAPPEADSDLVELASTVSKALNANEGRGLAVLARPSAPWMNPAPSGAELGDWSGYGKALQDSVKRYGFAYDELIVADVAARAGEIVVVPEGATDFVRCYAKAIAGGEVVRHALDPSVIGLDDLWARPGTGFGTGLARAWAAARLDNSRYHVVLLEGLHRTPTDLWLPSFVDVLGDRARPTNLLVFATLGPKYVDEARVWTKLSDETTGLKAQRHDVNARVWSALFANTAGAGFFFAPELCPSPDQDQRLKIVDSIVATADIPPGRQERALAFYEAAAVHEESIDSFAVARALSGKAEEATDGAGTVDRVQSGWLWLRECTQQETNT